MNSETFCTLLQYHLFPERKAKYLDAPLTSDELIRAASDSPNGKAPGLDGLPLEVYKSYGDILLPELLKVLNHAHASFRLLETMNDACIIVLIR